MNKVDLHSKYLCTLSYYPERKASFISLKDTQEHVKILTEEYEGSLADLRRLMAQQRKLVERGALCAAQTLL
eukprot:367920-Ditylum_brightwellii.AAC.1